LPTVNPLIKRWKARAPSCAVRSARAQELFGAGYLFLMGETVDEHSDVCPFHLASSIRASAAMCSGSTAGNPEANGDN